MKKLFKVGLISAAIALAGCNAGQEATASTKVELNTEEQKVAYSIGVSLAQYVGNSLEQQEELGIDLDRTLIIAGIQAKLTGESQLTDDEVRETLMAFDKSVSAKASAKRDAAMQASREDGSKWLAELAKADDVTVTESGLQYKVITSTESNLKPTAQDEVTVHYRGTLIDGTEFDSSYARNEPATFPLNGVIAGWTEALQLMNVGEKYELYIPSNLAYGERGAGAAIGPNSALKFEVELLAVNGKSTAE